MTYELPKPAVQDYPLEALIKLPPVAKPAEDPTFENLYGNIVYLQIKGVAGEHLAGTYVELRSTPASYVRDTMLPSEGIYAQLILRSMSETGCVGRFYLCHSQIIGSRFFSDNVKVTPEQLRQLKEKG